MFKLSCVHGRRCHLDPTAPGFALVLRKFFFLDYSEAPTELWDSVVECSAVPLHAMSVVHHPGLASATIKHLLRIQTPFRL